MLLLCVFRQPQFSECTCQFKIQILFFYSPDMEKITIVDDILIFGDCYAIEGEGEYIPVSSLQMKYMLLLQKK